MPYSNSLKQREAVKKAQIKYRQKNRQILANKARALRVKRKAEFEALKQRVKELERDG